MFAVKKTLSALAALLALISFVSCSKETAAGQDVRDDTNETTEIPTEITYNVPEMDCGGYEFKVVDRDGALGLYWITIDMHAEAENGEPINDAVFRRNRILEDKFNIQIGEIRVESVLSYAQKIIQSGSDDFDVCYPTMQEAGVLIQRGQIVDLYAVPWLDFDRPWWDRSINDSISVARKLYAAAGNITTMTNDATWSVLFNKELAREFEFADHYQLVKTGKWTLDVLYANSRTATKDINGDGIITEHDQWGTVTQHEFTYNLFAASGQKAIEKDGDDLPVLALNSDRTAAVLSKVAQFMSDKNATIKSDDFFKQYSDPWYEIGRKIFEEARALYLLNDFDMVRSLRSMETNFGILPLPKYDENQSNYYNALAANNATVMCLPATALDLERSGAILEAWAAESVNTLTKAYYDITLKGKNARDDESEEMLDMIFSTRTVDQGLVFNWAGIQGFFEEFSKKESLNFASQYEKMEPKWITAIEKTLAAIQ